MTVKLTEAEQYEIFRNAVQALDAGEINKLEKLLDEHPWLIRYQCRKGELYEEGYFAGVLCFTSIALVVLLLSNTTPRSKTRLKLPENGVFVMMSAADLLWAFDEKRARSLYWEAINSLNLIEPQAPRSGEYLSQAEKLKVVQEYSAVFELDGMYCDKSREEIRNWRWRCCARSARFGRPGVRTGHVFPDNRRLEQDIASEVAARDPAHALQLARESLGKGITFELLNLIRQLNVTDSGKASEFAGEVISKLRMTNVATDFRSSTVAVQLLHYSRMPNSDGQLARLATTARFLRLSDDQKPDLVEILTDAAFSASANSILLFDIPQVMSEIQQFFPERRAALEQKLAAFNETLTKQQQNQAAFNEWIRRGIPEEIVRRAADESDRERYPLYQQAAIIAVARGNTHSFRDLVSREIKDEDERQQILDLLDAEQISAAAYRKQIDELKKLLPKIRRKEERARAMVETALILKEKGEDSEAATLLAEAAGMIKADLKSETQTNALLALLSAYALIDPPKGFALAERTIDHANSQISMPLLVDRVVKSGAVKKSEIILDQAGIMPLDLLVFKHGKVSQLWPWPTSTGRKH